MKEDLPTNKSIEIHRVATLIPDQSRFLLICTLLFFLSCGQKQELTDMPVYEGPLSRLDSINTFTSDSGKIVMNMRAPRQDNFENGDREWSEGMEVEWYDKNGDLQSLFKANYVFYTKEENIYRAEGNVIVESKVNGDRLNTEELFWDQKEESFYTEKFVTIESEDEVHTGEGLESNQDFTEYHIIKPNGTFTLEDEPITTDRTLTPTPEKNAQNQ